MTDRLPAGLTHRSVAARSADAPSPAAPSAGSQTAASAPAGEAAKPSPASVPGAPGSSGDASGDRDSFFECNICLEQVRDPVITLCGHLYCWPCLYRWLQTSQNVCPVCKAGVTRDNVIPVYGRGAEHVDPRSKTDHSEEIPSRPAGQRPEPSRGPQQSGFGAFPQGTNQFFGFSSTGFGFFPSLFGLQFQSFSTGNFPAPGARGQPRPQHIETQEAILSRILLLLGIFVILCLLLF